MINMICPQCGDELEIDEGFRGGVCRCFNCGMLMTVPDDPDAGAEAPAPTPSRRSAPPKRRSSRSSSRAAAAPAPAPRPIRAQPVDQAMLDTATVVPVARKRKPPRKSVKYGVWGVVGVIMIALVGAVVFGMTLLFEEPPEVTPEDIYQEQFEITGNPYTMGEPNFIGLPVANRTIVMIDSSQAFANYLDYMKQMALRNIKTFGANQQVQFMFWRDGEPKVYPGEPKAAGQIKRDAMAEVFDTIYATGGMKVGPAFNLAITQKPDQITIVCHQTPLPDEMGGVLDALKKNNTKVNVVLINYNDPFFKKLAEETGGKYIEISTGRIRGWYEDFLNQGGQPYVPGEDNAPADGAATPAEQ